MKLKVILLALTIACTSNAFGAMATFTGRSEMVTTITGMSGWRCEYDLYGQTFWRVFTGLCPMSIDVQ